MPQQETERLADTRWLICLCLFFARENGISLENIYSATISNRAGLDLSAVRELVRYLEELGFAKVEEWRSPVVGESLWITRTAKLIDLCEFNIECPPSIARPDRPYWRLP